MANTNKFHVLEKDIMQKVGTYYEIQLANGITVNCDSYEVRDDGYVELIRSHKKAIMNKDGSRISPFKYENIGKFHNGIAYVRIDEGKGSIDDIKTGLINERLEEIVPPVYKIFSHVGIYMVAKKNEKWGLLNQMLKEVCDFIYDSIDTSINGYVILKKDGKCRLLDYSLKQVLECEAGIDIIASDDFSNYFAVEQYSEKSNLVIGIIDKYGNKVSSFKYSEFIAFSYSNSITYAMLYSRGWDIIVDLRTGKEVCEIYDQFVNGSDARGPFKRGNFAIRGGKFYALE